MVAAATTALQMDSLRLRTTLWEHLRFGDSSSLGSRLGWEDDNILKSFPPFFRGYYEQERRLPQHNASLAYPEGMNGRFLFVNNQSWGLGWNNVMQEIYMMSLMAYLTHRAFAFRPYTWHLGPELVVEYYGKIIPSRIPLSVILAGPMGGRSFPSGDDTPRAVIHEWHKTICPPNRTIVIHIEEVNKGLDGADAKTIMDKYVSRINETTESCVELRGGMEHPFDYRHFGSPGMLSIWSTISQSPLITHFEWSDVVMSALHTNARILSPSFAQEAIPRTAPDLMAIHVRRGDYLGHCHNLAGWGSEYMGWSQHPGLRDRFSPPPSGDGRTAAYMKSCLPTIEQIVERVKEAKRDWETMNGTATNSESGRRLKMVYVMSNGEEEWLAELKKRILDTGEWDGVHYVDDLDLLDEQRHVTQAVDMAIAERAAVFIGNGFSSLTSNVMLLRLAHELPSEGNRFW